MDRRTGEIVEGRTITISSLLLQQLDSWWAELGKVHDRTVVEIQVYKDLRYLIGHLSPTYFSRDKTLCKFCGKLTISKLEYCSICQRLREVRAGLEPKQRSSCRICKKPTRAKDLICAYCAETKDKKCPNCGRLILRSSVHCHNCTTPTNNAIRTKTYLILNKESMLVKIGHAIDVERRRIDLERSSGVRMILIATFPDSGETEERVLQNKFREFRVVGKSSREWFIYDKKIQEFLELQEQTQNNA